MSDLQDQQPAPDSERKKRPASQYYWGDWWKDKGLHSCSLTARGLWHEMNCLMHDGEPYGHLTLNGRPMTVAQLANQCRISASQCAKLLRELEDAGVPSRTPEGVIFSRRMVRDEAARNARAEGGKLGGEHGSKGAEHGSKGGRPNGSKGGSETPLDASKTPPPSSSSSSSPSGLNPATSVEVAPARPSPDGPEAAPQLSLVDPPPPPSPQPYEPPDCPHLAILALWAEVLPALPQHQPQHWDGTRAAHLRARWRETAVAKRWPDQAAGLQYLRRLFGYIGESRFLTGRVPAKPGARPFVAELEWIVSPGNWARVHEGKYHQEAA